MALFSSGLLIPMMFAILGMVMGGLMIINMRKPSKRVELLRPRDRRGKTLKVSMETDRGISCKPVKGVTHRFIKIGPGWTFDNMGRMVTRFFGIEGTVYTAQIDGPITNKLSLKEHLKLIWEDSFDKIWAGFTEKMRKAVEDDNLGVTVEIKPIDAEEENLPPLTADDIHDEEDNVMLRRFSETTTKKKLGISIMGDLVKILVGALGMYFLLQRGII